MKKLLLILSILPLIVACQNKKEYPNLIDKVSTYSDKDYGKEHFTEFQIYEEATTKNSKLPKSKIIEKKTYPWNTTSSKERIEKTLKEIEKSIKVGSGPVLFYENTSSVIRFSTLISNFYSQKQIAEYKKTGMITTEKSVLDYIKAEVKSYDLVNEKNQKIKLNQEVLGLNLGGFEEKNGNLLEYLGFETMGINGEYATLKGFIEIEIKIPTEYEKIEITQNSIGKKYTIGEQEIQILEFDANVLHYKLFDSDDSDFNDYILGVNNSSSVQIPESIYEKFRQNQGLDYPNFIKKYKEFGLEKMSNLKEKNFITIIQNDDLKIEKVFFYKPQNDDIIKRTIKVPVNITQLEKHL